MVNVGGCIVAPPACRVGELSVNVGGLRPKLRKAGLGVSACMFGSAALRALTARRTDLSQKSRGAFFFGGVSVPRLFRALRRQCLWNNDNSASSELRSPKAFGL